MLKKYLKRLVIRGLEWFRSHLQALSLLCSPPEIRSTVHGALCPLGACSTAMAATPIRIFIQGSEEFKLLPLANKALLTLDLPAPPLAYVRACYHPNCA